ncbi:gamma-glutamyltransferase [Dictyobacter kobayashii]|uniref:Gamma-glutamyltransferase n=1 Tax=Dictyobacter kobayashii TaxID=2014872 RepID=A0A402AXT1_9CHLR|nr:gamma-glutamyltransferase [Dictyobacter kobayashii]GCE23898.1 hypothetical protein KDK_76980 [Dictyobacter kobayashii]
MTNSATAPSFPQHRPVTFARRGVVAAPHYLASEAGLDVLKSGGNAMDAAIAANAMLQVVYPFVCGLGGDIFMMVYEASSGKIYGLNGSGHSAGTASIERYNELGYQAMPTFGVHTITVPGCVSGWDAASQRFGRLGLAASLAPAISYAEEGFAIGPGLQHALTVMSTRPEVHPSWHRHFLPDGTIPPWVRLYASLPWPRHSGPLLGKARTAFIRAPLPLRSPPSLSVKKG